MEHSGATFSNIPPKPPYNATSGEFGLGDAIYTITQALGISHCNQCAHRRERMNRMWTLYRSVNAPNPVSGYILSHLSQKDSHGKGTDSNP